MFWRIAITAFITAALAYGYWDHTKESRHLTKLFARLAENHQGKVKKASVVEVRTIGKPVAGTVGIYLDGVEQLSGWSVDVKTGIVTFSTAPAAGVDVTADFEFDVPVRFNTNHMAV